MDDLTVLVLIVSFTLIIPLSLGLALWIIARRRKVSDRPMSQDGSGSIQVPVRNLKRSYRVFGYAQNSLSPRLEIAPDGLRFTLFKPDHWPFAEIARIDLFSLPFITRMEVRSHSAGRLYIDVADKARARDFLRALPADLPFTQRAIMRRDAAA